MSVAGILAGTVLTASRTLSPRREGGMAKSKKKKTKTSGPRKRRPKLRIASMPSTAPLHRQIARQIEDIYTELARQEHNLKKLKRAGQAKGNPTLRLRWDIGQAIRDYLGLTTPDKPYGKKVLGRLVKALDRQFREGDLRAHFNYGSLPKKKVERHVRRGLSWRKALKETPAAMVAFRRKLQKDVESRLDA